MKGSCPTRRKWCGMDKWCDMEKLCHVDKSLYERVSHVSDQKVMSHTDSGVTWISGVTWRSGVTWIWGGYKE